MFLKHIVETDFLADNLSVGKYNNHLALSRTLYRNDIFCFRRKSWKIRTRHHEIPGILKRRNKRNMSINVSFLSTAKE